MDFLWRYRGLLICAAGVTAFVLSGLGQIFGSHFVPFESVGAARLVLSAQRALSNGQFVLRFANDYDIALQPIFLYYTPVVYGLAAIVGILTGLDAFDSLLVVAAIFATTVTAGLYRTMRLLGGDPIAAGLAAASLPFSPYFVTDLFARAAFAELSAWAVFPWVLAFFIQFCDDRRRRSALGLLISTALLILCHKIFLGWSVIFMAVFGLMLFGPRRLLQVSPRLLLAMLAALSLTAPYWLNPVLLGKSLNIANTISGAHFWWLTSNLSVFWPSPVLDSSLRETYQHVSLQLGPPIVLALIVAVFFIGNRPIMRAAWLTTVLATLFACSLFGLPSIWNDMPSALMAIQFPYRLLLFATSFGTIVFGLLLSAIARAAPPLAYAGTALLMTLLMGFWWHPSVELNKPAQLETATNNPNIRDSYFETAGAPPPPGPVIEIDRMTAMVAGNQATLSLAPAQPSVVVLPVQFSRSLIATANSKPAPVFDSSGRAAIELPAGTATIKIERIEQIGFASSLLVSTGLIGVLLLVTGGQVQLRRRFNRSRGIVDGTL